MFCTILPILVCLLFMPTLKMHYTENSSASLYPGISVKPALRNSLPMLLCLCMRMTFTFRVFSFPIRIMFVFSVVRLFVEKETR